jgi:hypothetical protein
MSFVTNTASKVCTWLPGKCTIFLALGYPTLKMMTMPGFVKGDLTPRWIDYESSRAADALLGAVQSHYPGNFLSLKDKTPDTLAEKLEKVTGSL